MSLQNSSCAFAFKPSIEWHYAHPRIGKFSLDPLVLARDVSLLHAWVSQERAHFWGMLGYTLDQVSDFYRTQIRQTHTWPYLGLVNGEAIFLLESYDPAYDELAKHYPVREGDIGMHFLIAPAKGAVVHGLSRAVMHAIQSFLFSDPAVKRIVVEPDTRNNKVHALNRAAGFYYDREIQLPHKTAHLAFCTASSFLPFISS